MEYLEESLKNYLVMVEFSCKLSKIFFFYIGMIYLGYIVGVEFLV